MIRKLSCMLVYTLILVLVTPAATWARPCLTLLTARQAITSRNGPVISALTTFFTAGATYNVDPRLAIAIAGQESNFGNNGTCATQRNNAWGWGGGPATCWTFASFSAGAERVTRGLREVYLNQGLDTLGEIGPVYCGTGPECGVWPGAVACFYNTGCGMASMNGNLGNLTYGGGCCGDCSHDVSVSVDEVIYIINIVLGRVPPCDRSDPDENGLVLVNDAVTALRSALGGCASP